jgi:hypothetical protein
MAVSTRRRFEVFKRDAFTCQYCGRKPPDVTLHVDHVVPSSKGGADGMENLVTSCATCNLGKSAVPLTSVPAAFALPSDIAERRKDLAERRKQLTAYIAWQNEVRALAEQERAFEREQLNTVLARWNEANSGAYLLSRDQERVCLKFIKQVGEERVLFAMEEAIKRSKPWKYVCGVLYNLIDPLRKTPLWAVVCNAECLASHSGIAWAVGEDNQQALERFAEAHSRANVPIVGADTYRVSQGTTWNDHGEAAFPTAWAPPVLVTDNILDPSKCLPVFVLAGRGRDKDGGKMRYWSWGSSREAAIARLQECRAGGDGPVRCRLWRAPAGIGLKNGQFVPPAKGYRPRPVLIEEGIIITGGATSNG